MIFLKNEEFKEKEITRRVGEEMVLETEGY